MPTTDSPGTGASNRRLGDASASARSFSRLRIVSTLTRCVPDFSPPSPFQPGFSPYIVTVGPTRTWSTETLIACCLKASTISSPVAVSSDLETPPPEADLSIDSGGSFQGNGGIPSAAALVDGAAGTGPSCMPSNSSNSATSFTSTRSGTSTSPNPLISEEMPGSTANSNESSTNSAPTMFMSAGTASIFSCRRAARASCHSPNLAVVHAADAINTDAT